MTLNMLSDKDREKIQKILKRREELLTQKLVPLQSEFTHMYGKELAQVILDKMNPIAKELMGLADPLKPPTADMLIKMKYEMPDILQQYSTEHFKVLTHKGILAMGEETLKKVDEAHFQSISRTVKDVQDSERYEYDRRLQFVLHAKTVEHKALMEELQVKYEDQIANLKETFRKIYEFQCAQEIDKTIQKCEENMNNRIKEVVEKVKKELIEEYDAKLRESQKILENGRELNFQELEQIEENAKTEARNEANKVAWRECKKRMKIQRHMLTCRNVTEIMHVICAQKLNAQKKLRKMQNAMLERCCQCDLKFQASPESLLDTSIDNLCLEHLKAKYLSLLKTFQQFLQKLPKSPYCEKVNYKDLEMIDSCGVFVFPGKIAEDVFCRCGSSTDVSLEDKQKIQDELNPRYHADLALQWEALSVRKTADKDQLEESKQAELLKGVPPNTDLMLARQILSMFDFDEIVKNALYKTNKQGIIEDDRSKFAEVIKEEFYRSCNEDTLMDAISCLTYKYGRKNSAMLATTDSVELLKTRRSSLRDEPEKISNLELTSSYSDISEVEVLYDDYDEQTADTAPTLEGAKSSSWEEQENLPETSSHRTNADTLKLKGNSKSYWSRLVKIPKYMLSPFISDADAYYHETTDEEWRKLIQKIEKGERIGEEETSSMEDLINRDNEKSSEDGESTSQDSEEPLYTYISKSKVRSIIDMLEKNEEISKMLHPTK